MRTLLKSIGVRYELFISIFAGIFVSILILSLLTINKSKKVIAVMLEDNLTLEVNTVKEMLKREHSLKLENAKNDLRVANHIFSSYHLTISKEGINTKVLNQETNIYEDAVLDRWILNGSSLDEDHSFVDLIQSLTGSTVTVFQKFDKGFVRISTNVPKEDGRRAVWTYIPNNSVVANQIDKNEKYYGRAYVVNDWYITAYKPINVNNEVVGMLYVGKKEKDMEELKTSISSLKIGKSGYVIIYDEQGKALIHGNKKEKNPDFYSKIFNLMKEEKGLIHHEGEESGARKIIAYSYFEPFRFTVAAIIDQKEESKNLVKNLILFSAITAGFFILLLSVLMFRMTSKKLHRYLSKLEESDHQLKRIKTALSQSEEEFRTLFNNTNDHIFVIDFDGKFLEVNDTACYNLGYSRQELLKKRFSDIKSPKYVNTVRPNLEKIKELGTYQYASEHLTKDGKVIPVEMSSRCINLRGRDVILSIARDITERIKAEQQLLTTIIETEEKERKRFAADIHDGLAPILSTVKLYTDLMKKGGSTKINQKELVENIDELTDQAISTAKEISNNIRPSVLQDFGLATAISDFCAYIIRTQAIEIRLFTHNYTITKRGLEETILYQALKELINNSLKYAQAKTITIDLKSYQDHIILYYRDDGIGFDLEKALDDKRGLGLSNLYNKIHTIKGNIDMNSKEGEGMFVIIQIRLTQEEKE